jgi:hypothetical protein
LEDRQQLFLHWMWNWLSLEKSQANSIVFAIRPLKRSSMQKMVSSVIASRYSLNVIKLIGFDQIDCPVGQSAIVLPFFEVSKEFLN